jgi:hypothetical protein
MNKDFFMLYIALNTNFIQMCFQLLSNYPRNSNPLPVNIYFRLNCVKEIDNVLFDLLQGLVTTVHLELILHSVFSVSVTWKPTGYVKSNPTLFVLRLINCKYVK